MQDGVGGTGQGGPFGPERNPYATAHPGAPYGQTPSNEGGAPYGYPQGPQPPYAAYGYGYHPGYAVPPQLPNGQAIAAMVLGILGIATVPLVLSVIAVCLGASAKRKADQGLAGGRSMAVAGLVTGWVGIGWVLALVLLVAVLTAVN